MDHAKHTIGECSELLRTRGWVVKELAVSDRDCPAHWRIDCALGNDSFTILDCVRSDAWNRAVAAATRTEEDR